MRKIFLIGCVSLALAACGQNGPAVAPTSAALLPTALPSIFGGFKVAITFAVVGTIVAEFVGSDHGLGYILVLARGNLDTVTVFAAILWLIAVA